MLTPVRIAASLLAATFASTGCASTSWLTGDITPPAASAAVENSAWIPHLGPVDRPEICGNAGETAGSLFHLSRPSGPGYPVQCKSLILYQEPAKGADKV